MVCIAVIPHLWVGKNRHGKALIRVRMHVNSAATHLNTPCDVDGAISLHAQYTNQTQIDIKFSSPYFLQNLGFWHFKRPFSSRAVALS